MLCFSEAQYLHRETWNRNNRGVQWIPEPYEGHVKLDWVAATSLTHHGTRYVPAAICYLGYLNSSDRRYCFSDSNGCAAGNTLEEAILQGFLELVERDAIALWWYNRVRRPPCDPRKLGDAELRGVEEIQGEGRSVSLLDLTADLGIPAIAAISANERGQDIRAGFGAHLDPRLAIRRAISELQQAFLRSLKPGQRELTLENSPQLTPLAGPASVPPPYAATDDLRDDILFCLEAARRRSLEVLVVNLTRPEIDFPVVRVLAPGMRHYRLRLAPGRLYQAPVDAGWLPQPLSEQELCSTIPPV
jgi:ribosomal protein S12 methylthiotransferase accessory factor